MQHPAGYIMTITVKDGSEYFRGLLLLIGKDRRITVAETVLMKRIGKALGFEKNFCDNAIQEILDNKFVVDEPPEFSSRELAMKFIRDGLTLAFADDEMHGFEESWMKSAAEKNGLDTEWFLRQRELVVRRKKDSDARLEVDDLTVEYSRHNPG
jgi:hypothetical protein